MNKSVEALNLAIELDISIPEAAALVGISRQSVYAYLKRAGAEIPLKLKSAGRRNILEARSK